MSAFAMAGLWRGGACSTVIFLLSSPAWAAWQPLGPFGGSASAIVADPHSSKNFLAGTRNSLLFRTEDGGESWVPLAFPAQLRATLNALAVDPLVRGAYLAGLSSDVPAYSGMFRSTDAGATWRQVPEFRNRQVRAIAFKRLDPKIIAAGTDMGVFLSRDGGISWKRISPVDNRQLQPVVSLAFDPKSSAKLYAGTPHLPWRTLDGGFSWHSIAAGMIDDSDVFAIQVDRNRPQRVFASACSGIYRSLDGGAAWTRLTGAKDVSSRTYAIVQDPQYENVWFAGTTDGIIASRDGGNTWVKLGGYAVRSIAFDPGRLGRMFVATDDAGILRSDDSGTTWQAVNRGFCNRQVSALWVARLGVYAAVPGSSANPTVLWLKPDFTGWQPYGEGKKNPSPAAGGAPDVVPTRGGRLLRATTSGLKVSDDLGATWRGVRGELESDSLQAICSHPELPDTVFVASFGVIYQSTDAGRSWKRISPEQWPTNSVRRLAVLAGSPDRLLVLTQQQGVWALDLGN